MCRLREGFGRLAHSMQNAHMRVQKVQRVLRFDARFAGEGCGGALWAQYEVSVTGFTFSAIWHDKHSGHWLVARLPPYPAAA